MSEVKNPSARQLTRLANLRRLISESGATKDFVQRTGGRWTASYISQIAGPNPTRAISEKTAREIETALKLPEGWLDQVGALPPGPPQRQVDAALLTASMQVVAELAGEFENDAFNPGRHGRIVALVYEDALRKGAVDASYAEDLLQIQKAPPPK